MTILIAGKTLGSRRSLGCAAAWGPVLAQVQVGFIGLQAQAVVVRASNFVCVCGIKLVEAQS